MEDNRSENQSPRFIGRRAGEIPVDIALQGVVLLLFSTAVGMYLTIGLQQIVKAYGNASLYEDPESIHAKSVFLLTLIAIAIGTLGGKSASWILSQKRILLSAIGLGLLGGFGLYQSGVAGVTGSNYYFFVLIVLAVATLVTFAGSGGFKLIHLKHEPHPGRVR